MKKFFMVLLLDLFLVVFFTLPSLAADWYLRTSIGVDWMEDANFRDDGTPALFGSVNGSDGRPIGAYGDFDTCVFVEGAAGICLLPWLRSEIAVAYRSGMDYTGQANFIGVTGPQPVSGDADSLSGLFNVYLDICGLPGVKLGRFRPYVGSGIGVAVNRLDKMVYRFPQLSSHTYSIVPSGKRTDWAFMMTAGTGFVLTKHLTLDLSYRYTDLGRLQTDAGTMVMDGPITSLEIGKTSTSLKSHGILMGLRYHF